MSHLMSRFPVNFCLIGRGRGVSNNVYHGNTARSFGAVASRLFTKPHVGGNGIVERFTYAVKCCDKRWLLPGRQVSKSKQIWTKCGSLKTCPKLPSVDRGPMSFLGICLGTGLAFGYRSISVVAYCKAKHDRNRLVGLDDQVSESDQPFDWKQFFELLRPEILYIIGAIISALAVAIVNIQIPVLLGDIINVVSEFTTETAENYINLIKAPAYKLIGMYTLQAALTFSYVSLLSCAGENMASRLRQKLFQSVISQDIEFFDSHKTGEIVNRLTSDVQDFKSSFKMCISQGLRCITQTIGCTVSLFLISPKLTVIMVVVIPSIIGVGTLMGSGLRELSRQAQAQISKATAVADEAIGNVRTVRAFAMEGKEKELYEREIENSCQLNKALGYGIGIFQGLSNLALNGIVLGTLFVGGYMMSTRDLQPGGLMSFLVATQTIQRSLAQMSLLFGQAVKGVSAGARVFEYMNMQAKVPLSGGQIIPYHSLIGEVEFKGVTFSYPTRKEQVVLENFSLKVEGGKMVALCGLSGGGKSTVAALLERFYDVTQGKISVDGHDICTLDPSWLRGRVIGFINQEPVLFATSVMENIRYGRPEATDEEVREAAKLANAHDFINGFPEGYATVLGERGTTVSGGQKQRIAIARALVKNPNIIILDEATSALDAESERVVQEALDRVVKGRTVIVIAHRLSTIKDADVIAIVSQGVIAEKGTHNELKKKKGLYWELIRQQELEDEHRHHKSG